MASKRSNVTWKIPVKRNAKEDNSQKDNHSVTYEQASFAQDNSYSETFMSDSYSDTFVSSSMTCSRNGSGETEHGKQFSSKSKLFSNNFLNAKTKSEQSVSVEESSIQEATQLETARNVTDALETVQEMSSRTDDFESFTGKSSRTDEFESFTGNDISETHPPSNTFTSYTDYSDTFESEEQTQGEPDTKIVI